VGEILGKYHSTPQFILFSVLKLAATLFTSATSGVISLFLTGGSVGTPFAQSIIRSSSVDLLAAGYKTPLAAVVFVAEATGGHAFIVPALIGAAVAYAVSEDASASGYQRLHEGEKVRKV
jgi:CIC family chloride channel protein